MRIRIFQWHVPGKTGKWSISLRWLIGLFRMAAEDGNAFAQGMVGYLYQNGIGVSASRKDGLKWVRKGADAGDAYSQSLMGYLTLYGKDVEKNYGEARKWLRMASDKGDAFAQYRLGLIYETGGGFMAPDKEKAAHWYAVSEENGNKDARNRLRELRKKTGG
ncbi:MAG: sel1 repeat family protein [Oxalobacter sp.]|nr:sel1 repeat family protein [Oxalobacter sp.]